MSALICNKCSTPNKEGADKCINCGFPFSNHKMSTVGKYLGEFAPKPTVLDAVVSGAFYPKSNLLEEDLLHPSNKETIFENDPPVEPLAIDGNNNNFNKDHLQNHSIENPIHDEKLSENYPVEIENQTEPNDVASVLETERIVQETTATPEKPAESNEPNCVKCGYILSDFSTICPKCGHNNVIVNATMRMPIKNIESNFVPNNNENNIADFNPTHTTGAYPSVSKQKDPTKTIAEYQDKSSLTPKEELLLDRPNVTQRPEDTQSGNKTIREGYSYFGQEYVGENSSSIENNPPEPKSPIRLEAIYLGQDSDQKMIINMPPYANLLNITRSLVDEGDSTISSGIHATIYKEGNEWKIENKASNKAVFVQVNDTTNIKDGDIIMMGGDKFYVFVDESNK